MARKPPEPDRGMDALGRPTHDLEPMAGLAGDEANDPKRFEQLKNEENARRRRDDIVLQQIMDTHAGRDWMYRKLAAGHIFEIVADLGSLERASDPLLTYFRDGERSMANQLLADVQRASPEQYLRMISDQNEKKALRDA